MGTNYYLKSNFCPHCERYEKYHIGKLSYGWEFHFRAFVKIDTEWIDDPDIEILSVKDWQKFSREGIIVDEYGTIVPYKLFWQRVKKSKGNKNHYDECIGKYGIDYDDKIFKDKDGFAFSEYEFF